jgi:hypothetical protein
MSLRFTCDKCGVVVLGKHQACNRCGADLCDACIQWHDEAEMQQRVAQASAAARRRLVDDIRSGRR